MLAGLERQQGRVCCGYEQRLPWCWTEEAAPWISQQLGLLVFHIACMVLCIALCWCWQCLLTVGGNLLPHTVTPLDVTTVAWCCRQTQVFIHFRKSSKCSAKFQVTVESKRLHCLTLYRKFLQSVYWRLPSCHAEGCVQRQPLITGSQTVLLQNFGVTQTAKSFLQLKWRKECKMYFCIYYKNRYCYSVSSN